MAKDKKSFILYADLLERTDHLTTEEKGILFQHILEYVNDLNPTLEDRVLLGVWKPIKQQLKRDLVKYQQYIDKQRENGRKGGRPKKANETQKTQPFFSKPKKADNDNDNVNDNDNDITTIAEEIFLDAEKNYTMYANQFYKDQIRVEALYRDILKHQNTYIQQKTLLDYLRKFVNHIKLHKKVHQNYKDFSTHFAYWLNRQEIQFYSVTEIKPDQH